MKVQVETTKKKMTERQDMENVLREKIDTFGTASEEQAYTVTGPKKTNKIRPEEQPSKRQ